MIQNIKSKLSWEFNMTLTVQSKLIDIGLAIADIKQCWIDVARNGVLPERKLAIDLCVEETRELIDAMNSMVAGYRDNNQEMLAKAWKLNKIGLTVFCLMGQYITNAASSLLMRRKILF